MPWCAWTDRLALVPPTKLPLTQEVPAPAHLLRTKVQWTPSMAYVYWLELDNNICISTPHQYHRMEQKITLEKSAHGNSFPLPAITLQVYDAGLNVHAQKETQSAKDIQTGELITTRSHVMVLVVVPSMLNAIPDDVGNLRRVPFERLQPP